MSSLNLLFTDESLFRAVKRYLFMALCVHLLCSFFSTGFIHHDEHYQIVEFVNLKLGATEAKNLPWEFQDKMRPWFQPGVLYAATKFLQLFGTPSTYTITTVYRLISACLGWLALVSVLFMFLHFFGKHSTNSNFLKKAIFALCSVWYLPFFHNRASADNWGACFFLIGLGLLVLDHKKIWAPIVVGVLMGLAIEARFQVIVAVGPVMLFFLIEEARAKRPFLSLGFQLLGGLLFAKAIGVAFDSWGYEQFTVSQWNYLVKDYELHIKSTVLPNPWYDYFRFAFNRGIPPLSLFFILGVLLFWTFNPWHILTAATLPFFLIHTGIQHKELRYIYPVMLLAPMFTALVIEKFWGRDNWGGKILNKGRYLFWWILVPMNFMLLLNVTFTAANGAAPFYHFFESYLSEKPEEKGLLLQHLGEDPYVMVGHPLMFYRPKNLATAEIKSVEEIKRPALVFSRSSDDYFALKAQDNCEKLFLNVPEFALDFKIGKWPKGSRVWSLFRCL